MKYKEMNFDDVFELHDEDIKKFIDEIINSGSDINNIINSSESKENLLIFSLMKSKFNISHYLIDNGINCNETNALYAYHTLTYIGKDTPLDLYVKIYNEVKKVIEPIKIKAETGENLLNSAISGNNVEIVRFLLKEGISPNDKGQSENALFDIYETENVFLGDENEKEKREIMNLMFEHGVDIFKRNYANQTALTKFFNEQDYVRLEEIIKYNKKTLWDIGDHPIHLAIISKMPESTLKIINDSGYTINDDELLNILLKKNQSLYHLACNHNPGVLNYLLDQKVDGINKKDIYGMTPIHYAFINQNETINTEFLMKGAFDKFLLNEKIDWNIPDKDGRSFREKLNHLMNKDKIAQKISELMAVKEKVILNSELNINILDNNPLINLKRI